MSVVEFISAPVLPRSGTNGGSASEYRMAVVGSRAVAGRGRWSQAPVLSGHLARLVGRELGRGIDLDSVVAAGGDIAELEWAVAARALDRFDAVVLVLQAPRPGAVDHRLIGDVRRTIASIQDRMADDATLVVAAMASPVEHAHRLSFVDAVRVAAGQIALVVELDPGSAQGEATTAQHLDWAKQIVGPLLADRPPATTWSLDPATPDEELRSRTARRIGAISANAADELQAVVDVASDAYSTRSAAFSLIAGPTTTFLVARQVEVAAASRNETLCHTAMQCRGGLVVSDAGRDVRFQQLAVVRSGEVGFYAGYPVLSPGGLPIGVVCVWDAEPREDEDTRLLEELARRAEAILWCDLERRDLDPVQRIDLPTLVGAA